MVSGSVDEKDPTKVAAGALGAQKRWGPRRVVKIGDLSPAQRRLVLALVEAARAEPEKAAA